MGNSSAIVIGMGNSSAIVIGMGNSSAISTPKIMKITAIKKNRDENGSRAVFWIESTLEW
jgi:hypothetical protein